MFALIYISIFLIVNFIILFIDTIVILPYLVLVYFYLLSPIYYIAFILLGYYRIILPIILLYFFCCFNLKDETYYGYSLMSAKNIIFFTKWGNFVRKYKIFIFYIFYIFFFSLIIYNWVEEFWLFNLIFFWLFNIIIFFLVKYFLLLNKNLTKELKINLSFYILICFLLNFYLNLFGTKLITNEQETFEMESAIWENYWFKIDLNFLSFKRTSFFNVETLINYLFSQPKKVEVEVEIEDRTKIESYIKSRFMSSAYKYFKAYTNFLNQFIDKFEDSSRLNEQVLDYDTNIWELINNVSKQSEHFMFNKKSYIDPESLLLKLVNSVSDDEVDNLEDNIIFYPKELDLSPMDNMRSYFNYTDFMYDDIDFIEMYHPLGQEFLVFETWRHFYNQNDFNLDPLFIDDIKGENNQLNSNLALDEILWNTYHNYPNKLVKSYNELYYNRDLINISIDNFFLNLLNNKNLYYNNFNLATNEIVINSTINKTTKYEAYTVGTPQFIEFRENNDFHTLFDRFFETNLFESNILNEVNLKKIVKPKDYYRDQQTDDDFFNAITYDTKVIDYNAKKNAGYKLFLDYEINQDNAKLNTLNNLELNDYTRQLVDPNNILLESYLNKQFKKFNIYYDDIFIFPNEKANRMY